MKKIFESLLDQLKDKDLITDEQKETYSSSFDSGISEIKENALQTALDTVDEEHAKKLEKVLSKIDEDHSSKLEKVLEKIDEDHTSKLDKVISAIDEDHCNKLEKVVKQVTENIDIDHGKKLEQILDKIDEDHTAKLEQVVEAIDKDHTEKLEKVIETLQDKNDEKLMEHISDYLDTYLNEVKPKEVIVNEAKLKRFEKMFEGLKEILIVNDDVIQTEVKEAILDAKDIIESKDKEINRLMLEKVELTNKIKNEEAQQVLMNKLNGSSPKLKAYLETTFKNASKDIIEEKFDEAVDAFEKDEQSRRDEILENEVSGVKPKQVITENLVQDRSVTDPTMDQYVNMIKKSMK